MGILANFSTVKTAAIVGVAAMLSLGSASAQDVPQNLEELIAAANEEGALRLTWGTSLGSARGAKQIVAAMNKKYGTNIELQFTPGGTFTQEVASATQEMQAGKPASSDMIYNNSGGALKGSEVGLYMSLPWEKYLERPMLTEEGFEPIVPGGVGIATASTLIGVLYNSDLVKGEDVPKSINDILDPKWKGKIAATPFAMGMREFAMPDVLGQDAMIDFTEKLSAQVAGLIPCGQVNKVTSGEFLMLIFGCGDQYPNMAKKRGEPLDYALMNEAVFSHTRYGMVPVHSQHPYAAALFIVWLHSEEGQQWMWDEIGMDLHLYPASNNRKKLQDMRDQGAKVVVSSPQWLDSQGTYQETRMKLEGILKNKSN